LVVVGCGGGGHKSPPRATGDRADDFAGPQIHFVYAVPAGRAELDHHRDTDGTLATSIVLLVSWFHQQPGAPILAVDTYRSRPDITYVRLPRSDQAYERDGADSLAADVRTALPLPTGKLYAIYYDGTLPSFKADVCGVGSGRSRARYAIVFVAQSCFDRYDFLAAAGGAYNRLVFVMAHEIVHELGFVPDCAPHSTGTGHVDDSRRDLMYPLLGNKVPILDVNHDDYFGAHVKGCPDLSRSRFLKGPRSLLKIKP
jgi:hypothetical protein